MELLRPTQAIINLRSIQQNVKVLRGLLPQESFFCPMLKANAYGHGDVEVGRVLMEMGITHFGLATYEEGERLRQLLGSKPKLLVFTPLNVSSAKVAIEYDLTPVVNSWFELEILSSLISPGKKIGIHIKLNTGMNRLGFQLEEVSELASYLKKEPRLVLEGLGTHLLYGEDANKSDGYTSEQILRFSQAARAFGKDIHLHVFNSSGLLSAFASDRLAELNFGARPGISIYGHKPILESPTEMELKRWEAVQLRPAMKVISELVAYRQVPAGEVISYNATYKTEKAAQLGTVPIGYADGYRRGLSNKAYVLVKGKKAPVRGIVCMDHTMVELDDEQVAAIKNDEGAPRVTLMGEDGLESVSGEFLADCLNTNVYEVLTGWSPRVPRVYEW